MARTAAKDERLHLRVDAVTKQKLVEASACEHQSVSDFVLAHAVPAAERVLEANHSVTLTRGDWDAFFEALVNPPPPADALRDAFRRYREHHPSSR